MNTQRSKMVATVPLVDMALIYFKFFKHCKPEYSSAHYHLNNAYAQAISDADLDSLFEHDTRVKLKPGVLKILMAKIIEMITSMATQTSNTDLITHALRNLPMFSQLYNEEQEHLCEPSGLLNILKNAQANGDSYAVVSININAL